ncbi:hypothetical protein ACOYR1_16695 [Thalassotalea piscium]
MDKNKVVIHNPIFYDLGIKFKESVETVESITQELRQAFPSWQEQEHSFEFIAYNFSYLSLHIPHISFLADEESIRIGGVDIKVRLIVTIRINGTLCFEYQYHIEDSHQCDLPSVVHELQSYTNVSYKNYLKRKNTYINSMEKIKFPEQVLVPEIFNHGETVDLIINTLKQKKVGVENDYIYPYQHGRILYSCHESNEKIKGILFSTDFKEKAVEVSDGGIFLDTWKTVIFSNHQASDVFLALYFENLANFFKCQTWIFHCEHLLQVIDEKQVKKAHTSVELSNQAKLIESLCFTCNRKMINFTNLSIPFKSNYYTELSKVIMNALKLDEHINQTHKHFAAIKEHINIVKIHSETRKERNTNLLKIFMALNLSAGIASLIPTSLDGDVTKFETSIIPTLVWVTFGIITFIVFFLESRDKKQ